MLLLTPDTSLLLCHAVDLVPSTHSHLNMVLDICDVLCFCLFVAGGKLALLVPFVYWSGKDLVRLVPVD